MLCVSSFFELTEPEPGDEGREGLALLLLLMKDRSPLSRLGVFGAVREEKPLGGLEVRMTGEDAANSSRETGSSRTPSRPPGWV